MKGKYKNPFPSFGAVQLEDGRHDPPSPEALAYFRDTVLAEAVCPICKAQGLAYLYNQHVPKGDGTEVEFAYSVPINIRGSVDVLTDLAVQYGMCVECGFLAAFSELTVKARWVAAKRDGVEY